MYIYIYTCVCVFLSSIAISSSNLLWWHLPRSESELPEEFALQRRQRQRSLPAQRRQRQRSLPAQATEEFARRGDRRVCLQRRQRSLPAEATEETEEFACRGDSDRGDRGVCLQLPWLLKRSAALTWRRMR